MPQGGEARTWLRDEEAVGLPKMLDHAQYVPNSSVEPALAQVGAPSWGVCKTVGIQLAEARSGTAQKYSNGPSQPPARQP
jgi:hypothetical protein